MAHTVEPATSGRSKCRGCGSNIAKDELRFGERLPNPFADEGDMTLWFHVPCAAHKRPESLLEVIEDVPDGDALRSLMESGIKHHRLQRINGLEQAPSGRARCRACKEMIAKGEWRIPLVFFEDGMFNPSGNIHVTCSDQYFETSDVLDRLAFFSGVDESGLQEVGRLLDQGPVSST